MSGPKLNEKWGQVLETNSSLEQLLNSNSPDTILKVFQRSWLRWLISRRLAEANDKEFLRLIEGLLASQVWNSALPKELADKSLLEAASGVELFVKTFRTQQEAQGKGWWPRIVAFVVSLFEVDSIVTPLPSSRQVLLEALALFLGPGASLGLGEALQETVTRLQNAVAVLSQIEEEWAVGFKASWRRLTAIAAVQTRENLLAFEPPPAEGSLSAEWLVESRQNMFSTLKRVESVALQAQQALQMTSRLARQTALSVTTGECRKLRDEPLAPVPIIEHKILRSVLNHWLDLLVEIGAREAYVVVAPPVLENPYTAGDPVTGSKFFDREAILGKLRDRVLSGQSIMLIGHRRSGKSSILMEFEGNVTAEWLAVYVTMERLKAARDSGALLYRIMLRIEEVMRRVGIVAPALEPPERFLEDVSEGVDSSLKRVLEALRPRRLVLCLDEYEVLEEEVQKGKYNRDEVEYFIGWLLRREEWLRRREEGGSIIVAGRKGPTQLREQFSQPLFVRLTPEWIDLLAESDARQLITNPVPDFPVNYEPEVVERILKLTAGQPYLIQLICQTLVDGLVEALRQDQDREWMLTMSDLEAALGPQHYEKGNFYYGQVWYEAGEIGRVLLKALATTETGERSAKELLECVDMASGDVLATLKELTDQRIIAYDDHSQVYKFAIPLMRHWVEFTQAKELRAP